MSRLQSARPRASAALAVLLAGCLTILSAQGAETLSVGDAFPPLHAKDQHDQDYVFEPGTRAMLIAFDMSTSKAANHFLAEQGAGYLDRHGAVYIANIYGMPGIGRYFALPKMRKYPQRIVLADEKDLLDPFPREDGRVTVIHLDDAAVVRSVEFWDPKAGPPPFG